MRSSQLSASAQRLLASQHIGHSTPRNYRAAERRVKSVRQGSVWRARTVPATSPQAISSTWRRRRLETGWPRTCTTPVRGRQRTADDRRAWPARASGLGRLDNSILLVAPCDNSLPPTTRLATGLRNGTSASCLPRCPAGKPHHRDSAEGERWTRGDSRTPHRNQPGDA